MYQILTTDFPGGSVAKNLPANVGDRVKFLVLEDPHVMEQLSLCSNNKRNKKPTHHI